MNAMDIIELYQDYSVDFVTEGHKHCRPGWVNTPCPFCTGNPGYHLGFNMNDNYFHCWRCGGKYLLTALSAVLNIPEREVKTIIQQYDYITTPKVPIKKNQEPFEYPSNLQSLSNAHVLYLQRRGFDPDQIIEQWQLKATGPISKLDTINYKNRIIIPYQWDKQIVSFDSRSISDGSKVKYIACPKERELVHRKDILYGKQSAWTLTGICVEGPTDVWRFGEHSFAVSGIQYTSKQLRLMATIFKRIAVVFDPDPQAILQANKLVADLKFRGVEAWQVPVDQDPGSMRQEQADEIVKKILNVKFV